MMMMMKETMVSTLPARGADVRSTAAGGLSRPACYDSRVPLLPLSRSQIMCHCTMSHPDRTAPDKQLPPASTRISAAVVDGVIYVLGLCGLVIVGMLVQPPHTLHSPPAIKLMIEPLLAGYKQAVFIGVSALNIIYHVGFIALDASRKGSLGKRMFGLRVQRGCERVDPPIVSRFVRAALKLFPAVLLSMCLLHPMAGGARGTWAPLRLLLIMGPLVFLYYHFLLFALVGGLNVPHGRLTHTMVTMNPVLPRRGFGV